MRKGIRIAHAIWIVLVVGAAAFGWYMMSRGFSAKAPPNRIEAFVAPRLRNLAIPSAARQAKNPIPDNPEALKEAMEHFADHCATCHGNDGGGNTQFGKGLYPKPPDMRLSDTQKLSDGELYYIIENGVRFTGMPAFGDADDTQDEDTWKLVLFIRHVPNLTPEQVQHIDNLMPKSAMERERNEEIENFLKGGDIPSEEDHKHLHKEHQ